MARTVRDVAALYEILTVSIRYSNASREDSTARRVAVATNFTTGHPATDQLFLEVVDAARHAGTSMPEIRFSKPTRAVDAMN